MNARTMCLLIVVGLVVDACTDRPGPVAPRQDHSVVGNLQVATSGTLVLTTNTTLTGNHYGNILIGADNVTLDCAGDTLFGPGSPGISGGIEVDGRTGVTVRNCVVTGFLEINGIFGGGANNSRFERNVLYGNGPHGIHLDFGSGNVIVHNMARSNRDVGIELTRSTQTVIDSNAVSQNRLGIILDNASNANTIVDNVVEDNPASGIVVEGGSTGNHVVTNTVSRDGIGIVMDNGATGTEVRGNTVIANIPFGIFARASTNLVVVSNTSVKNSIGFVLWGVTESQYRRNTANLNSVQGMQLVQRSTGNVLDSNTANQNLIGISVEDSNNVNTISHNVANGNVAEGFKFFATNSNVVFGNTGNNNGTIGYLVFGGSSFNTLTGNTGRVNKVLDALDDGSGVGNLWANNNFNTTAGVP